MGGREASVWCRCLNNDRHWKIESNGKEEMADDMETGLIQVLWA